MIVDFTQPRIVLSVSPFAGNRWIVADQTKLAYYPPTDLEQAVRFMRAMAIQTEGVEIDEQSVVAARAVDGWLSERDERGVVAENWESGGRAQRPEDSHSRTPALIASRSESHLGEDLVCGQAAARTSPPSVEGEGPTAVADASTSPVPQADSDEPASSPSRHLRLVR